jgi:UDP-glucuronate 4-epimerase
MYYSGNSPRHVSSSSGGGERVGSPIFRYEHHHALPTHSNTQQRRLWASVGVCCMMLLFLCWLFLWSSSSDLTDPTTHGLEVDIQHVKTEPLLKRPWPGGKKTVLVTGGAGFIGSYTAEALLARGDDVIIVDELNDYYDVTIKEDNLQMLIDKYEYIELTDGADIAPQEKRKYPKEKGKLSFYQVDICNREAMSKILEDEAKNGRKITHICHLAARAGVRYSIENPDVYVHSNVQGTLVLLDLAREYKVYNFVYASSSSVYGNNEKVPFSETDPVDHPVSPYAATKRAMELLCSTYNHLYEIPMAGLRFFTVYGPRGRPDMAPFKFIANISRGQKIEKYGDGTTSRDYTYITDIVQGVLAAIDKQFAKMEIFNLGNSNTVTLNRFIEVVEEVVGKKALIRPMPLQPGDVPRTYADLTKSKKLLGYEPKVSIEQGLKNMADWYKLWYGKSESKEDTESAE